MRRWRGRVVCWACVGLLAACGGDGASGGSGEPVPYEGDEAGECDDGADNDQDTLFDCDDPGCAGAPICQGGGLADVAVDTAEPDTPDVAPDDVGPDDASDDVETVSDAGPVEVPVDPANPCPPLAAPEGPTVEVSPSQADELGVLMATAEEGTTFLFTDGVYELDGEDLWLPVAGVTLRSKSGDRDAVVLDGGFETDTAVTVAASQVTLAEMTIRRVLDVGVRVQPDPGGGDVVGVRLLGLSITDALGRAVAADAYNAAYADAGVLACSHVTLTEDGRARLTSACDIGGVDLRQAAGWTLRDNRVEGLWCEDGLAQPALLAWRSSADTVIERNRVEDCTRGIGLGEAQTQLAGARQYDTFECATSEHVDHYGGVVRNNMVYVGGEAFLEAGADFSTGVHVWSGCRARVVHNTVVSMVSPYSSIEWRWAGTVATEILNNLVSHNLRERTGATAFLVGNLEDAPDILFADPEVGDLHLAPNIPGAINAGEDVPEGLADHDFEGDVRLGVRDIGADEWVE